jgi:hypothetical protein
LQVAEAAATTNLGLEGVVLAVEGLALSAWLQGLIRSQLGQAAQVGRSAQIQFSLLLQALAADVAGDLQFLLLGDQAVEEGQVILRRLPDLQGRLVKEMQEVTAFAQFQSLGSVVAVAAPDPLVALLLRRTEMAVAVLKVQFLEQV